jgi:hypothetical protein
MKKTLCIVALLSVAVFANEPNSTETKIIQENVQEMKKMDKVDKEIRVINASIEKKKISIYEKFKEMDKIFDNYQCETAKVAITTMKVDIANPENMSTEELTEAKEILKRLKSKLNKKCGDE